MGHLGLALGAVALALGVVVAGVQLVILPKAACNQGTVQAHESIPSTLPNGTATPGRLHVPQVVNGNCTTIRP